MKYLLRLIIVPLVYLACFAFATTGIASAEFDEIVKSIISAFMLLIYIVLLAGVMFKEGQDAYGVLLSNDAQRRNIIKTGIVVDFDASKEYKPWKGFVVGLICCIPLVVMVLLHTVAFPRGDTSRVSIICEMVYGIFFSVVRTYQNTNELGFFIITGAILLVYPCMLGVPYVIGAHSRMKRQEEIKKLNEEFHGGK